LGIIRRHPSKESVSTGFATVLYLGICAQSHYIVVMHTEKPNTIRGSAMKRQNKSLGSQLTLSFRRLVQPLLDSNKVVNRKDMIQRWNDAHPIEQIEHRPMIEKLRDMGADLVIRAVCRRHLRSSLKDAITGQTVFSAPGFERIRTHYSDGHRNETPVNDMTGDQFIFVLNEKERVLFGGALEFGEIRTVYERKHGRRYVFKYFSGRNLGSRALDILKSIVNF